MPLHVVLVEPEIHVNTGNIARTCACTGLKLHLVQPLGFSLDDRYIRRSGVDYWPLVEIELHNSFDELVATYPGARFVFTTTEGDVTYRALRYRPGDFIVFGKESTGLSDFILENYPGPKIRIPMLPKRRSLNLSNAVAIVVYEALAQLGFPGLV
ncbi:MAG: tRNA (cytidine(34)-2'-O)-methyltransferase [Firmicutes bacterium]|nr:tRNA (cytidine(34)-2'-O)-methyltransferase [Bacillota bacterium]